VLGHAREPRLFRRGRDSFDAQNFKFVGI